MFSLQLLVIFCCFLQWSLLQVLCCHFTTSLGLSTVNTSCTHVLYNIRVSPLRFLPFRLMLKLHLLCLLSIIFVTSPQEMSQTFQSCRPITLSCLTLAVPLLWYYGFSLLVLSPDPASLHIHRIYLWIVLICIPSDMNAKSFTWVKSRSVKVTISWFIRASVPALAETGEFLLKKLTVVILETIKNLYLTFTERELYWRLYIKCLHLPLACINFIVLPDILGLSKAAACPLCILNSVDRVFFFFNNVALAHKMLKLMDY